MSSISRCMHERVSRCNRLKCFARWLALMCAGTLCALSVEEGCSAEVECRIMCCSGDNFSSASSRILAM